MKIPFGYRFWLIATASLTLSSFWIYIVYPGAEAALTPATLFSQKTTTLAALLLGLIWHRGVGRILRTRIRKIPYILYLLFGICAFVYATGLGYEVYKLSEKVSQSNVKWGLILNVSAPLMIGVLPCLYMYVREWMGEHPWFQQFFEGDGGSARWGTIRTFSHLRAKLRRSLFSFHFMRNEGVTSDRIFLGQSLVADHPFSPLVGVDDDSNMVTTGIIGSGKSISVIFPCLLMYEGDAIVYDPSGEHANLTFERRCSPEHLEKMGVSSEVKKHFKYGRGVILDPFGITDYPSSFYSILSEIDINSIHARELVEAVADGLISPESNANQFWEDLARSVVQGLIAHVLSRYPKECHTLPFCLDLLYGKDPELKVSDPALFKELLLEMRMNDAAGGLPMQAAADLDQSGDRQRGAILAMVARSLRFAGDPAMRNHLSRSDFSFKDFGLKTVKGKNGKARKVIETVYIVLPDSRMKDMMRWMRALTSVSLVLMQKRPRKPERWTLYILDEFAKLGGQIKALSEGYATLRKFKVKLWIFLQSISQLQKQYPERCNDMLANSNNQILSVGMGDPVTPKFTSDALGKKIKRRTERRPGFLGWFRRRKVLNETARELLTPSEVATKLSKTNDTQIVFGSMAKHPIRLKQISFKRLKIRGKLFKSIGLDGLEGHYAEKNQESSPTAEQKPKTNRTVKKVEGVKDEIEGDQGWFSEN